MQPTAIILYTPTKTEVDYYNPTFPLPIPSKNILIPQDKNSNPFEWASLCADTLKNENVCILIPGTQFDIYGTRHGKGAGWYDRFLYKVPRSWLRIGITHASNLTQSRLLRQEWDEPMDWIISYDGSSWTNMKLRVL